ncbi:transcriptional regulator, MarR family [Actinobacteria bacterium OK006]|nr:transcriptional regulator, MarR family [Actinobacteria bacterium OK006]
MDQVDLRRVFDDLVRFETILWNTLDARLRQECGVPLGSLSVLLAVSTTPSCRVQDIAGALAITVGGASQAVDRLEKLGHCLRRPNPADRRSSLVDLSPSGKRLLETASSVFDRELDTHLRKPLSQSALAHLAPALATLRNSAARHSEAARRPQRSPGTQTCPPPP